MDNVIRFTEREEAKALPIILRHSQGAVLPNRTYVLGRSALEALRAAGVSFQELSGTGASPASAATKEFDQEFVRETFGPPNAQAKTSLADARAKRRNTNRNGSANVSISVERKLLKQADAFAKQHRMS